MKRFVGGAFRFSNLGKETKLCRFLYRLFPKNLTLMNHLLLSLFFPLLGLGCQPHASSQAETQTSEKESVADIQTKKNVNASNKDSILRLTDYTKADSMKVVSLLRMKPKGNDVLFYARQLIGVPYVAATLEGNDPERLVVNLRQLDCTTLVETVLALTLTHRESSTDFSRYCENLMLLRYRGGRMEGYLSRLHYFTWWMHDNVDKGIVEIVEDKAHFTSMINVQNHYMSAHPDKYKMLTLHPEWTDSIKAMEDKSNGPDGYYLPEAKTSLSAKDLKSVHDGDIVAIVTRKDGIDYSHLGFAVWGKDGKLHLLNASSIHHKVVEEPKTLRQYLKEHPSSIGIRLLRMR